MWEIMHKIGFAICHQLPERSFFVHDHQMPLCSRCTGIYLGIFITILFYFFTRFIKNKKPSLPPNIAIGAISIFFICLVVFNAISPIFNIYTDNILRFITGILFGISLPLFLLPAINYSPKSSHDRQRVVSKKEYGFLILLTTAIIFLATLKSEAIFYIFSYLSVVGLLLFIMLINTAIITLLLENIKSVKNTPYYYAFLLGSLISGIELFIFSLLHSEIVKNLL